MAIEYKWSCLGVAVAALLCGGCGMIEKPTAHITGASLQNVSLTEATLLVNVDVVNPYGAPLPLSNVDYALSSQGQPFMRGQADVAGTVPANSTKALTVPVRINYLELLKAVKSARPGTNVPYKADMGLSVDAPIWGKLRLPMSREGELAIPSSQDLLQRLGNLSR